MTIDYARLHVRATVPPGASLVGVLPQNLIRLERVKLSANPSLFLMHGERFAIPFDGRVHTLTSENGTTMCLGAHLSLFLRNESSEPQLAELQFSGLVVDGPERQPSGPLPELSHGLVLGLFAQEAIEEPEPETLPEPGAKDRLGFSREDYAVMAAEVQAETGLSLPELEAIWRDPDRRLAYLQERNATALRERERQRSTPPPKDP